MKSNPHEEVIDLSELVRPVIISPESSIKAPAINCQEVASEPYLRELVARIPQPLQKGTVHIFIEFQHLLKYLDLIEEGIKQDTELDQTIQTFNIACNRTNGLVGKIKMLAMQVGKSHEILRNTLEEVGFAVKHELRRVSKGQGLVPDDGVGRRQRLSRSEITTSSGILQNCFQQAIIAIAQVFDPMFDVTAIFKDYKLKREQSIVLHRELTLLLHKLHRVEKETGLLQKLNFVNNLKQFHQEMMHFLMYRDWEEFEGFVNEIVKANDETGNLGPVLHRFASYLETLLKHVGMRAVLNDKPVVAAKLMF